MHRITLIAFALILSACNTNTNPESSIKSASSDSITTVNMIGADSAMAAAARILGDRGLKKGQFMMAEGYDSISNRFLIGRHQHGAETSSFLD